MRARDPRTGIEFEADPLEEGRDLWFKWQTAGLGFLLVPLLLLGPVAAVVWVVITGGKSPTAWLGLAFVVAIGLMVLLVWAFRRHVARRPQ